MHRGPRFVLAFGVLLGVVAAASFAGPRTDMLASNYLVYHHAALTARAGEAFYTVSPPSFPGFTYMYPPATVLVYYPLSVLPWWIGFAIQTATTLLAGVVLATFCLRTAATAGVELERVDQLLVVAFCLAAPQVVPTIAFGNVNLLLAAGLAAGFVAFERGRELAAGIAVGAVAAVKAFPALVGVWFLRRRSPRAIAATTATGGGVLLVGLFVFGPEATLYYFFEVLFPRAGYDEFVAVADPTRAFVTLHRPLGLLVDAGTLGLVVGSVAVVSPAVAYCYTVVETPLDRLVAIFATIAATLLVFPSYFVYYPLVFFPLVPLLYLLSGSPRWLFLSGAAIGNLAVTTRTTEPAYVLLPDPVADTVVGGLEAVLTVATFPTVGLVVCLAGCCLYVRRRRTDTD